MGVYISKLLDSFREKEAKVVMVGLDAAGKTTILYKLHLGEVIASTPTIGFNVERVKYKRLNFTAWDIGGQDILRKLWYHYYDGTDAIIFVVDSNDSERIEDAKEELNRILQEDRLKDSKILIYANKQDLPKAMSVSSIAEALELKSLPRSRKWFIQSCCAHTADGLYEGLEWLNSELTTP